MTATLRHAPNQSDEAAWEPIRQAILADEPSFRLFAKARAEATLAGAAAEREACKAAIQKVAWVIQPENDYGLGVKDGADGQLKACVAAILAREP